MITVPTLEDIMRVANGNEHDPEDLGHTIGHLNKTNPTSEELKLTQCHLELAYMMLCVKDKYGHSNS